MNLRFFVNEAWRALSRNAAPSMAALVTVMITTIVLGVFIPVTEATTGAANEVRGRIFVDVFLKDGTTPEQVSVLRRKIVNDDRVKSVTYISKEQARESLNEDLKQAAALLDENPLPASLRVVPQNPDEVDAISASLTVKNAQGKTTYVNNRIDEVRNGEDDTEKILSVTGGIKWAMWALAILLMLAATALVANTIRLSLYARRREIEVMRLVGATAWFIRWPFVIEGLVVGFCGGLLAVLLLGLAKATIIDPLADSYALFAAPDTISFTVLVIVLLVASMGISAVGSGITLRRFLKI